jgi:FlaA1/EpsC-like NDP-sugar epimerase
VRDDQRPDGDIAIVYTGLRPGEKLYEELLIGADTLPTTHPRIQKSLEPFLPEPEFARELGSIAFAIDSGDLGLIHAALRRTVDGYVPDVRMTETVTVEVGETVH